MDYGKVRRTAANEIAGRKHWRFYAYGLPALKIGGAVLLVGGLLLWTYVPATAWRTVGVVAAGLAVAAPVGLLAAALVGRGLNRRRSGPVVLASVIAVAAASFLAMFLMGLLP